MRLSRVLTTLALAACALASGDHSFEFEGLTDGQVVSCYESVPFALHGGTALSAKSRLRIVSDDLGAKLLRGLTSVDYNLVSDVPYAEFADGSYTVPDLGDNREGGTDEEGIVFRLWVDRATAEPNLRNYDAHVHLKYVCTDAIRERTPGVDPAQVRKEACATANAKLASLDEPSFDSLISSGELGPLCQAEGKADGCRCQAALLARFWEVERAFTAYHCAADGSAAENVLALSARVKKLHQNILDSKCVAAPCGTVVGGFCSTEDVCTGEGYTWTASRQSPNALISGDHGCVGASAGCCEPKCSIFLADGRFQPGQCGAKGAVPAARGAQCWPLVTWFGADQADGRCGAAGTQCCSVVPCAAGDDAAQLDGVCMSRAACGGDVAVSGAGGRCTDAEVCCKIGIETANSLELDNPNANQESSSIRAAFRGSEETLQSSASALAAPLAAMALVALV